MIKGVNYREIKLLKQNNKSTVSLVQEQGGEKLFVRKRLKGRHPVYQELQGFTHPGLPRLYEVVLDDESTTVIEEYIEGETLGNRELSKKQFNRQRTLLGFGIFARKRNYSPGY